MALTPDEIQTLDDLYQRKVLRNPDDQKFHEYVTLTRKIEQLGMAIPPEMRRFLVPAAWPRVVVEVPISRQQIRSMILPGEDRADKTLQEIADANNLAAHIDMFRQDCYTYGRAFMSVGANESGRYPLMRVESPREIEANIDVRQERMTDLARFYGHDDKTGQSPTHAVLYRPDYTKWIEKTGGRWVEVDRDVHKLGAIPFVMHLNRRWSGGFEGESELTDILPLTDSAIRSLTNLQFAQEAHGVPSIWATGVSQGDFAGPDGTPISQFEAYYDVIKMLSKEGARWGQFMAADLKNFETALQIYGKQAAIVTGFPARMFGLTTTNPSTEGAIIADEIQLVRNVEKKNLSEGVTLGWAFALAYQLHTGRTVEGNRIRVEYHDPATPTIAQREDALSKRRAAGVLSREGYWDELGWSEARKAKERDYLRAELEEMTPYLADRIPISTEA